MQKFNWRTYWARWRLLRPVANAQVRELIWPKKAVADFWDFEEHALSKFPEVEAYARMAPLWDKYARRGQANYATFLDLTAKQLQVPLRSVLDLACGTGNMIPQLMQVAPDLVGVDSSAAMLEQAIANCATSAPRAKFVKANFESFSIGRNFDAVVCRGNSLNYLSDIKRLLNVFQSVAGHLTPNGLFVFDVFGHAGMQKLTKRRTSLLGGREPLFIRFEYDVAARREVATVFMQGAYERHLRIPIDLADISSAADEAGLIVLDNFSDVVDVLKPEDRLMSYYVLQKPATSP